MGPAREVYERPAHPYTRGLIDAVPIPDPVLERQRETVPVRGELPSALEPPSGCRFRTRCPLAQDVCAEVEIVRSDPLASVQFGGRFVNASEGAALFAIALDAIWSAPRIVAPAGPGEISMPEAEQGRSAGMLTRRSDR